MVYHLREKKEEGHLLRPTSHLLESHLLLLCELLHGDFMQLLGQWLGLHPLPGDVVKFGGGIWVLIGEQYNLHCLLWLSPPPPHKPPPPPPINHPPTTRIPQRGGGRGIGLLLGCCTRRGRVLLLLEGMVLLLLLLEKEELLLLLLLHEVLLLLLLWSHG